MQKRIYLSSPTMHGEEMQYIKEAFETNWIAPLGANVNAFEQEVAARLSDFGEHYDKAANNNQGITTKKAGEVVDERKIYAAALSAGTAAIHLALINEGIGLGDVVFCQDLTFSATCNPIIYQGAKPIFIDSEQDSWNMDPAALQRAFELYPAVKAVIVVNLYGTPAKLSEIVALCKQYGVPLIEDAAESLGAFYKGRPTGTFGNQAALSFNGNKIITTSGGGMLVSASEEKIVHARFLATQAREQARHYEHKEIGYNYRMSNVVAGIGRGQLLHLGEHVEKKKAIYRQYKEAFSDIPGVSMNPIPQDCEPNYWLSCLTISPELPTKPVDIMLALEQDNIECRPIWKPMHLQPVFRNAPFVTAEEHREGLDKQKAVRESSEDVGELVSVSEEIFNTGLCLPSDVKNTLEDMERIIRIVRNRLGHA